MGKRYLILIVVLFGVINASLAQQLKLPKREFRGVWVASVENIDWPNKPGESTDQQKKELTDLLDAHHAAGINAVMLQIRPAADAFYTKSREPWSKWLTGKQGTAPDPLYDPLEFAIQEAHKRGMELHAWFNPYRATKDSDYASLSPHHITNIHPEWFFEYGGQKLFNPGLPEVQDYIIRVILDVVDNYDIDGVHMDDYFYPYHVAGQQLNDQLTYAKYGAGFSDIKDWRRDNVNRLVKALGDSIHAHNPRLKYGMSPFSIWANKYQNPLGSDTHGGDSYYELYADSRKWVQEGWVDYINPQLYRPLNDKLVAFNVMINWWASQVTNNRHIYIGQAPYRIIENKLPAFGQPAELPNEIKYLRNNPRIQGSVYFSSKSLTVNPLGFTDSLRNNYYHYPALPPVMLWLDSVAPMPPIGLTASVDSAGINLKWQQPAMAKDSEAVYGYVIYRFDQNTRINTDDPQYILSIRYDDSITYQDKTAQKGQSYVYVVTAIDRLKNESDRSNSVLIKASPPNKPNELMNK